MSKQTFSQGPLKDMVGLSARNIDSEMQQRGYEFIKTEKSSYTSYTYWWNNSKFKCVSIATEDGRIASALAVGVSNCNQYNRDDDNDTSQANNDSHRSHYNASYHEAAYEKGYNDSKYDRGYNNFYNGQEKQAYSQGYNKSKEERHNNTYNSGYNGHHTEVKYKDLVGWHASSAHDELHSRGFREVKRYQKDRLWIVWEHKSTGKCIKTGEEHGDIKEVQESEKCDD